jgi:hypothetical protein
MKSHIASARRDESNRLLQHLGAQPPYLVQNTVSLNKARESISLLTEPLADTSQIIRTKIELCEERAKELVDTRMSRNQRRKNFHL